MPLFATLTRLQADLDALRPLAPDQEQRVLQKFRLEWNYNSNAIEGNSLTLGETRSLLLHGLTAEGKPLRDHLDIKGHNEAILGLEEVVRDERPLTEHFIREMHQVLLGEPHYKPAETPDGLPTRKRIVPGQYKTSPNNVRTATGEIFYFASPEETPARMTDLVDWYRQEDAQPTLHPVALAAEFHYRFVRIHPFDDGNGRMSRLLMNLVLMRHGYPITVIKAADRNRYLAALSEADAGEPEPFLRFVIENVEASLRLMIRAAQGESIDEPDDLDKKLALLKKQILKEDEPVEIMWSGTSQAKFFESFLKLWIEDFVGQTQRFDFAFVGKVFKCSVFFDENDNGVDKREESIDSNASILTDKLESWLNQTVETAEVIEFDISWQAFKSTDSFDLNLSVHFWPDRTTFSMVYSLHADKSIDFIEGHSFSQPKNELHHSLYKNSYDHTRIHEINYQLANKVLDFIEAKIAEADSATS